MKTAGILALLLGLLGSTAAQAQVVNQVANAELAQQLSNPVASLISVPFQFNFDENIGPSDEGRRTIVNVQPVVPFSIGEDWNLIARTIVPFIDQRDVIPGTSQSGIGDIVQSLFFSPKRPTAGGTIWGVGPVFLLPWGSSDLSSDQFAAGPTGVVLRQAGGWTYGALANHLWDVGGGTDATRINQTFFQPFVTYTTDNAWTFAFNTETTYNWETDEASVPLNLTASKLTTGLGRPISIGGGLRYWAESPEFGPEGWGARLIVTFLFPR
jgi:hypothetical protein